MGSILHFTFSPDGKYLAACDSSYQIKIWEVATDREVALLLGHQGWVWHLQFSHDGKYLVSGSSDRTLRIWDLTTYSCIQVLEGNHDWVWRVGLSLNSKLAISLGADRYLRIWWWRTGQNLLSFRIPDLQARDGAFHVRRGLLAVCNHQGLKIWQVWQARCIQRIKSAAAKNLRSLGFTPNGKTIVGASFNCEIHGWDVQTGNELWVLRGHPTQIFHLGYDGEGQMISACSEQVRLWDLSTGSCIQQINIARDSGNGLIYRPPLLVTGSDNGVVKFWNLDTGKCLQTYRGNAPRVMELTTNQRDSIVATTQDDGTLHLWDFSQPVGAGQLPPKRVYPSHRGMSTAIAFSQNGQLLASTGSDRAIHIWDVRQGLILQTFSGHTDRVSQLRFIDDRTLFSHSNDGTGRQWDITTGRSEILTTPQQQWCMSVDCSPCGRYIAFGSIAATVTILDRETKERRELTAVGNRLRQLIYTWDNLRLIGITDDGYLNTWHLEENDRHAHFYLGELQTTSIVCHPLSLHQLIIATEDGTIAIWDVERQVPIDRVNTPPAELPRQHHQAISTIAILPHPDRLISCNVEGTITVWEFHRTGLRSIYSIDFPHPYQDMKITDVKGLNRSQLTTLVQLGAIV
jgi:WD40 repeat protein